MLQSLGVDYIDESEVLTPADYANHIDKWQFTVPFVCGATNLGEALRRITEGAAMIRSKGEAGTGDVSNAVTHMRTIRAELRRLQGTRARRAVRRRQGAPGAVRPRPRGGRGRQAAGRAVHRRRHRHPRRRGDDDAARRRGRLRRLGHLQVRQPGRARRPRSSRRPPSTTTPTSSPRSPVASVRPWSASTSTRSPSPTGSPSAAGRSGNVRQVRAAARVRVAARAGRSGTFRPEPSAVAAALGEEERRLVVDPPGLLDVALVLEHLHLGLGLRAEVAVDDDASPRRPAGRAAGS